MALLVCALFAHERPAPAVFEHSGGLDGVEIDALAGSSSAADALSGVPGASERDDDDAQGEDDDDDDFDDDSQALTPDQALRPLHGFRRCAPLASLTSRLRTRYPSLDPRPPRSV